MKAGRQWRLKRADVLKFLQGEKPMAALPLSPEPILMQVRELIKQAGEEPPAPTPDKDPLEEAIKRSEKIALKRLRIDAGESVDEGASDLGIALRHRMALSHRTALKRRATLRRRTALRRRIQRR